MISINILHACEQGEKPSCDTEKKHLNLNHGTIPKKKKNGYYHIFQVSVHFVHLLWNAVFVKLGDALCELFVHGRPLKIISNDGVVVTNFLNIQEILLME